MAGSRLEKIGTIYTRTTGLLRSGALKWEDRPLWYDLYEAFPPKDEPMFDRPTPNVPIKKIFYQEDKPRATFHRNNKHIGAVNLFQSNYQSLTQKFIDIYKQLDTEYKGSASEEQLYKEAIDLLKRESTTKIETEIPDEEEISLSSAFKAARSTLLAEKKQDPNLNIKVRDLFKD